jgi:hypothetical protein
VWQPCDTDRLDFDAGTPLEPLERVGLAVAVQVADQLRVLAAELVRGQLVGETEVDVEVPAAEVPERVPVEVDNRPPAVLGQGGPERGADGVPQPVVRALSGPPRLARKT